MERAYFTLLSKLEDDGMDLNIQYDYIKPVSASSQEESYHFESFTHFGSAVERLKNTSEGKLPKKYINDFQEFIGISEEYFQKVLDRFTNKSLFKLDSDGNLLKDNENNLKRKFFPS